MIRMPQCERELFWLLKEAAELGAQKALIEADLLRPYISLAAANRKYGGGIVERWIQERLIEIIQDGPGSNYRIDRIQIEAVAKTANRHTYLNVQERSEHHQLNQK
jgi:hypothetical protein